MGVGGAQLLTEDIVTPAHLRIAAIIPLYNGAKYIGKALESVLAQRLQPFEIVVVDDGSTDDGPRIVSELAATAPIRLLRKQNGGQASARNFGVAASASELIALLDQDDIWYPSHLQRLAEPFLDRSDAELGWVYCNLDEIDEAGNLIGRAILSDQEGRHPKRTLIACLRDDMFVLPSASLISRQAFERVGGFDERLRGYEDDDLFLRLFRAGFDNVYAGFDNVYLEEPLSQWRIHMSSAAYSPHMAKSRLLFATKLLTAFPDDPVRHRFYARHLLVPRFYPQMVEECKKALRSGDKNEIGVSFENLQFVANFLPPDLQPPTTPANCLIIAAIIPLYNGAVYIEKAIRTVLEQTLIPAELIVVDDGSMDQGAQIVEQLATTRPAKVPIRLLRQSNGGQSSARNLGARHAHGDLIAFLDQDDVWYPDHLEKLARPYEESRSRRLGWVYSDLDEINEDGTMVTRSFLSTMGTQHPKRDLFACLREDMFVLPSASLISRRAFLSVGGFDEQLMGYEDDDLFLRLFQSGHENVFIDEPLSQWRIYTNSTSYSWRMAHSRMIYAKKLLDKFPNNPDRQRYFQRDILAPRFFPQMMAEYGKVLRRGDREQIQAAFTNLRFISRFLRMRVRIIVIMLLPVLKRKPLAKVLFACRGILRSPVLWLNRPGP
jgi:glycosyltransferase involved in cell wall biosynthesis